MTFQTVRDLTNITIECRNEVVAVEGVVERSQEQLRFHVDKDDDEVEDVSFLLLYSFSVQLGTWEEIKEGI